VRNYEVALPVRLSTWKFFLVFKFPTLSDRIDNSPSYIIDDGFSVDDSFVHYQDLKEYVSKP